MEPTDIQLMLRVRDGDVEAFRELAARYREPLRRFLASLMADSSQADDGAQETLLRLWMARERYEPVGKFSTYLFQIAKRSGLRVQRTFRTEICAPDDTRMRMAPAAPGAEPETIVLERLRRDRIRRAVAKLPPLYAGVFRLCHEEGLRYRDAAKHLGIPVGTVKSRMAEALKRLRRALSPMEDL